MFDTVGVIHCKWFPVNVLDVDSEDLCLFRITALVQKLIELVCVCIFKDPFVAHVELECQVSLTNLFDTIPQLRSIIAELFRAEDS